MWFDGLSPDARAASDRVLIPAATNVRRQAINTIGISTAQHDIVGTKHTLQGGGCCDHALPLHVHAVAFETSAAEVISQCPAMRPQ
jgi:hypothetical protein